MKKVLLIILILFLATVSGLALLVMSMFLGWPLAVALVPPALFIGLPLLYLALKALLDFLARRRYAKSVLNREKQAATAAAERGDYSLLRQQWHHGLMAMRPSSQAGPLDPLRDLPWILLLGPSSSGKRLAMAESGLFNNFRTQSADQEAKRRNSGCDWYFFENSVYLDVKGLFFDRSVQAELNMAKDEWETFLDLISSCGRRFPLEGLVLALPAQLMVPERETDLREYAIRARERLDSLARRTDQTIPIFVLLTRMDLRPGLAQGLWLMEQGGLRTGYSFEPAAVPEAGTAFEVIGHLENGLRNLFIQNLGLEDPLALAPLMAAPDDLAALERPLSIFLTALGHFSSYSPNHRLRGVFFSAKVPDAGQPARPGLEAAPKASPARDAPGRRRFGLVHGMADLFGRVIPESRGLTKRLNLPGSRRQKAVCLGLGLFYLAALLLGLSLMRGLDYDRLVSRTAQEASLSVAMAQADKGGDYLSSSNSLGFVLDRLESLRGRQRLPLVWSSRGDEYIGKVKSRFQASFESASAQLLSSIEQQVTAAGDPLAPEFSVSLNQLLWLFSVYDSFQKNEDYAALARYYPVMPRDFDGPSSPYWTMGYAKLLLDYLALGPSPQSVSRAVGSLERSMARAMELARGRDLDWLLRLAQVQPSLTPVTLEQFWGSYFPSLDLGQILGQGLEREVPAIYTLDGRQDIVHSLDYLKSGSFVRQIPSFDDMAADFMAGYDRDYLAAWRRFAQSFLDVSAKIPLSSFYRGNGRGGPQFEYGQSLSTYPDFIESLHENLLPFLGNDQAEPWLKNVELDWAAAKLSAIKAKMVRRPHLIANKAGSYREGIEALKTLMPNSYFRTDFLNRVIEAQPHLDEFNGQQSQIVALLRGQPDEILKLAEIHFGGSAYGDVAKSPFTLMADSLRDYGALMFQDAGGGHSEEIVFSIHQAIQNAMKRLAIGVTASRLDDLWNIEVQNPIRFLSRDDGIKALYGPNGLIVTFLTNRVAPFVEHRGQLGYSASKWDDFVFPFTDDFLSLLTVESSQFDNARLQDQYEVTISAVATLVDAKASEKPERTSLTLKASDSVQTMDIYNYPASRTFVWKPATGADTTLTISLPSLDLFLSYSGPNAFPSFLEELIRGDLVLAPGDFPDHAQQLAGLGITEIRVIMKADGALPVIGYHNLEPPPLPSSIIKAE